MANNPTFVGGNEATTKLLLCASMKLKKEQSRVKTQNIIWNLYTKYCMPIEKIQSSVDIPMTEIIEGIQQHKAIKTVRQ